MFEQGDVIHAYSRADALKDGVLVDAGAMAREAGFKVPVALTAEVWATCVGWSPNEKAPQDEDGRLWDVLGMASLAARAAARRSQTGRVAFEVYVVPRGGRRPRLTALALVLGPGDQGECVATVLMPDED
ncbi:MAG: hypothetical protein BGP24_11095 [Lysobacterales bacterium 69-70]|nr:hypothetical protein [Xanthomonadaceae bacterium]ODU30774.1 MAG: hypothetical protein ABS97_20865 [Xanthomonadaceae bacterium SCN 69-320]ODV22101.1 MAG: hypothetical protein ABT27_02240 [Xanthomonadaceae bacterium SCN 69-25]OJY98362.1 MAG: hypothetical protein BGP24_11095 [Xanthomonadales bacterium 69-70]